MGRFPNDKGGRELSLDGRLRIIQRATKALKRMPYTEFLEILRSPPKMQTIRKANSEIKRIMKTAKKLRQV